MPRHVSGIFLNENFVFTGYHLLIGQVAPAIVNLTLRAALGFVPHPHKLQNPIESVKV